MFCAGAIGWLLAVDFGWISYRMQGIVDPNRVWWVGKGVGLLPGSLDSRAWFCARSRISRHRFDPSMVRSLSRFNPRVADTPGITNLWM